MKTANLSEVLEPLRAGSSFLVVAHVNPDGDAVGSILAMRELLNALGKENVTCAVAGGVPHTYRWLPGADTILLPEEVDGHFDTVIVLDCSTLGRTGEMERYLPKKATYVIIDHHLEDEPYGAVSFVDSSYAATGEILVDLFEAAGLAMDRDAALYAYVAIATDTGGFRYANTTPRTHRAAARLLETGLDVAELSERLFERMTAQKFALLAHVLGGASMSEDGRIAWLEVRSQDIKQFGATPEDMDGLINFPRHVDTVDIALMFKEQGPSTTKISVRARNPFNAAEFCKKFDGGGHAGAAGATIHAPLDEAKKAVLPALFQEFGAKP